MNIRRPLYFASLIVVALTIFSGCKIKYSLSGASISPQAKTVTVSYFPNNATMVAPVLSTTLTESLQDKFQRQTKLAQVSSGGDLSFEGEITNYTSEPVSISGSETASLNRLTITVKVRFTNVIEPNLNYDKAFTSYSDYSTDILLQEAEETLIPEIVDMLVDDIFNAAVSNW